MNCVKPYIGLGKVAWPCGQCMACRINKRRIWTHRIMLEAMCHEECSFVTLTYDDAHCPEDGSVCPLDLGKWLKRLRKRISPKRVRYFAVGEYGDVSGRPHYHVALFGYGPCRGGKVVRGPVGCECEQCVGVRKTWGFGHVSVMMLEMKSAQYISGYVVKKMTKIGDLRLNGRRPEFARMSLWPGIGAGAIPDVASEMMRYRLEVKLKDAVIGLRHGSSVLPLGRYLRRKLRAQIGLDENAPAHVLEALRAGLLPVFADAELSLAGTGPGFAKFKRSVVGDLLEERNKQKAANLAARETLLKRRVL